MTLVPNLRVCEVDQTSHTRTQIYVDLLQDYYIVVDDWGSVAPSRCMNMLTAVFMKRCV